jgi:hypothetical protein
VGNEDFLGAFLRLRRKNRAFRSNLFYRFAVKKDFRCNPWRRVELPRILFRRLASSRL